jgi:hypothetical protein
MHNYLFRSLTEALFPPHSLLRILMQPVTLQSRMFIRVIVSDGNIVALLCRRSGDFNTSVFT